jgi:hypothetical protein
MRPRVFIGSSNEAIGVANALQAFLEDGSNYPAGSTTDGVPEVRVWKDAGIFPLAETVKESLVKATLEYDFAVMIFSGEDTMTVREVETPAPRDNVVFEAGLFAGALGFDRLFIVTPRAVPVRIPSDLAGFTRTTYLKRADGTVNVNVAGTAIVAAIGTHGVMWNDNIEPKLRKLVSHARAAYNIRHDMFHEYLETWCTRNLEQSQLWPDGAMTIESDTFPWLADVYHRAQKNIFSTTIPKFMPYWRKPVGTQLLRAQVELKIPSTRIFVFPDEKSVKPADKITMAQHRDAGIEVRTFFDKAVSVFDWDPSKIETDFTFVDDGEVIGVTTDTSEYRSRWFFKNAEKKKEFARHKKSLIRFSDPF